MRLLAVATAVSLGLTLSSCGGDDEPPAAASPSGSSAAESDAPSAEPEPTQEGSATPAGDGPRLTGDGVDLRDSVLLFGTAADQAIPVLQEALGEPSKDTGEIEPFSTYGTCPGSTLRVLEYGGGALQLLFGDPEEGEQVLYGWALTSSGDPASVPRASALVGDEATLEFGVGTTVGELQEQTGEDTFTISEDELTMDPAFTLADQSSGFRGFLSGTSPSDTVTFVDAGTPCGE